MRKAKPSDRERGQREIVSAKHRREAHESCLNPKREPDEAEALEQEADMYPCENPYDPLTGWKD